MSLLLLFLFHMEFSMSFTESYRKQHKEMLDIATQISQHLKPDVLAKDAKPVRSLLSQLFGKLNIHLAMEDKALYPRLLQHDDTKVKQMANSFIKEMGGIAEAAKEYNGKWAQITKIQDSPQEFIQDTKGLFSTLAKRIQKEDNELYELVDKI